MYQLIHLRGLLRKPFALGRAYPPELKPSGVYASQLELTDPAFYTFLRLMIRVDVVAVADVATRY
jgi:hypothetical protein